MIDINVKNFISFCFNFHIEMGINWTNENPDYILEKWNNYIGEKPKHKNINADSQIKDWINIWQVEQRQWFELKEISKFLSILNTRSFNTNYKRLYWTLPELIEEFEGVTGIDIKKIENKKGLINGLHEITNQKMFKWIDLEVNKRHYKLLQIL